MTPRMGRRVAVGAGVVGVVVLLFGPRKIDGPNALRTNRKNMANIATVAVAIRRDTGCWPPSIADMVWPAGGEAVVSLVEYPRDPWGHDYVYLVEEDRVVVKCLGSDGVEGGEGEAADLVFEETIPPTMDTRRPPDGVSPTR